MWITHRFGPSPKHTRSLLLDRESTIWERLSVNKTRRGRSSSGINIKLFLHADLWPGIRLVTSTITVNFNPSSCQGLREWEKDRAWVPHGMRTAAQSCNARGIREREWTGCGKPDRVLHIRGDACGHVVERRDSGRHYGSLVSDRNQGSAGPINRRSKAECLGNEWKEAGRGDAPGHGWIGGADSRTAGERPARR